MASTTKGNIKNRLRRTHARDMDDMADSMVTLTDTQTISGTNSLFELNTYSFIYGSNPPNFCVLKDEENSRCLLI